MFQGYGFVLGAVLSAYQRMTSTAYTGIPMRKLADSTQTQICVAKRFLQIIIHDASRIQKEAVQSIESHMILDRCFRQDGRYQENKNP